MKKNHPKRQQRMSHTSRVCRGCGRSIPKKHRASGLCQRCQGERSAVVAERLAVLAAETQNKTAQPE